ncbi:zf-HC2 domain-containing protein [Streptomyces sp. ME02-8801-2C]|uniref:zf-HC2 domain-containing protein n=1 Tax=Streptomyces sp. ME02-8801-2C TaxID=3028680 RepID=UPI0029A9C84E|nr:zf-HC2 domain-containing protein [Streptomyces sp. ME02-8801-2C]MDX3451921.1 zf-HC2 domain-containing protein [Streptomyces sp. ME02-8801-2C]
MRSLERHRDVGAYALGVLDEADAFRFEDHLMECPQCAAHVTEFGPATRQLLLYRRATPRSVHPMAQPGPSLLDRLLGEVANRRRADRRRWLYAVAAAVVFAVAGPGIAIMASGGDDADRTQQVAATDERSGVWAQVTSEDTVWGSQIELKVKDGAGPRACHLVAIADDGTEETLTNWNVPEHDARASTMMGASTLHSDQIDKYELRTTDGLRLVTLDAP